MMELNLSMKSKMIFTLVFLFVSAFNLLAQSNQEAIMILEYKRADNMMAGEGAPSASMGTERLVLTKPGQRIEFDTDWKHEKKKNNGRNYFGSHLRFAENKGNTTLKLFLRPAVRGSEILYLVPGMKYSFKNDLVAVEAGEAPRSEANSAIKCIFEYERADNPNNAAGLPSNSLGVETLSFSLGEEVKFETDWKYEKSKGDDQIRYGSHMRRVSNKSPQSNVYMDVTIRRAPVRLGYTSPDTNLRLMPNQKKDDKADIVAVKCLRR